MSFFRNLRSSITRGRSSSRDTTPVRTSRPGSVISSLNSIGGGNGNGGNGKRRDSMESKTDSLINRSDTFILDDQDHQEPTPIHSNCSTLEKKSKKSKVLEKFSTFTKRKKTPSNETAAAFEHHPSDNATNTYYKWQADGVNSLDYDSQSDPFNFLYEQHSSLKSYQGGGGGGSSSNTESLRSAGGTNAFDTTTYRKGSQSTYDNSTQRKGSQISDSSTQRKGTNTNYDSPINRKASSCYLDSHTQRKGLNSNFDSANNRKGSTENFDSSTYRKGKMPTELKKQLVQLKQSSQLPEHEHEEYDKEDEDLEDHHQEGDKYKTVTLNSFRKSFRDKFLQQQKEAPHNPAWFVEVDPPSSSSNPREASKENRRDLLVFENDNYRPGSRSPIRDLNNRKANRSQTRSPVKRNDTFKVERVSRADRHLATNPQESSTPSIRIEFKNSITPHMPGRMVPVGVAKPMPSTQTNINYYAKPEPIMNTSYTIKSSSTTSTRLNNQSPHRNWSKTQSPSRHPTAAAQHPNRLGRYQTLVQIRNDKSQQSSPSRSSRLSTKIQLGSDIPRSPSYNKRYTTTTSNSTNFPLKQTYFGETPQYTSTPQTSRILQTSSYNSPLTGVRTYTSRTSTTSTPVSTTATTYHKYQPSMPYHTTSTSNLSTLQSSATAAARSAATTPSHSVHNIHHSGFPSSSSAAGNSSSSYLKHQQPRIIVAAQRRSRSPIKIPWR